MLTSANHIWAPGAECIHVDGHLVLRVRLSGEPVRTACRRVGSRLVSRQSALTFPFTRLRLAPTILFQRPFGWSTALLLLFVAVVGFLVCYPLVMLLLGSFSPPRGSSDLFSLEGYRTALFDGDARRAFGVTMWLSLVRVALAVFVALFLAWVIQRTNVPGRAIFHNLVILSVFLPLLPQILAWSLLLSPKSGLVNLWLRSVLNIDADTGPFNVYSYGGIIFVAVLGVSGFLYLLISPAFEAMDGSLEEAARISGANSFQMLLRIELPLLLPAILGAVGLAFVRMMESFQTELVLGTPAGIYVYTTQIYYYIHGLELPNYPAGIALSTVLIVLTSLVIFAQAKILGNRSYVTVSGKGHRSAVHDLGKLKYVFLAVLIAFFGIRLGLPLVILGLGAFQQTSIAFQPDRFTLEHLAVLKEPLFLAALKNTLVVALVAATLGMIVAALSSYVVVRTTFRLRRPLDVLTWVPYMVPSFVLSVGFLWAVLKGIRFPFTLYGTLELIVIAFIVRLLPLGVRQMNGTMVQLSKDLEEAARMSGASWFTTVREVVVPLLRPSITIGWLIFVIVALTDLDTVILLYGVNSTMVSVSFFTYWSQGSLEKASVIGLLMTLIGLVAAGGIQMLGRLGGNSYQRGM
jgi:iron(III) transport system permease protein